MPFKHIFERATHQTMRLGACALAAGRLQLEVKGLPHIPKHGPVLLVVRHYHHLFDGVALLLSIPRPIHILMTLDWVRSGYVHQLMKLATTMARWPVVLRRDALRALDNSGRGQKNAFTNADIKRYQRRALRDSVELLRQERVLVLFPEGYPGIDPHYTPKTRPEEFLSFRSGFATIAAAAEKRLGARVPIVPSGLCYTKDSRWTAPLNIGEAFYLEDFASRQLLVRYTEQRVAELSGRS
jgi:1-acyl-sn-glycerol-3-phosphate acyltransferase